MNKRMLFLVFFFVLLWNLTIMLFRDVIEEKNTSEILVKSAQNTESEKVQELIAVYNHENKEVIHMPLEDYIVCVLSAEMPVSYGLEALKAQAVAARTYTIYCIKNGKEKEHNADVCTDYRHCQAYKSSEEIISVFNQSQASLIRQAVNETEGKIITYEGEPINAVYHASSDKMTENAQKVWGSAVPYLVSVPSENESGMPGFESKLEISLSGFFDKLNYAGYGRNFASDEIYTCKNDSGRVDYISVKTKSGETVNIPGVQIRTIFSLRSCSFDINIENDNVFFSVRGYGHGVGMSQYGAKVMAQSGKTYEQILLHYYADCKIDNLSSYKNF